MFPNINSNHTLTQIINLININSLHRKLMFKTNYTKKKFFYIKFFKRINLINGFLILKNNKKLIICVKLLYFQNLKIIKNFKIISKPSKNYYISLKALILLNKRTGGSIYIISTSVGLLSHKEALNKKVSGFLIGCFYN